MEAATSPQSQAVGEPNPISTYTSLFNFKQSTQSLSKTILKSVEIIHEPTVKFTMKEINQFTIEEGLHQALVLKFSFEQLEMQELRKILSKHLGTQGRNLIGHDEMSCRIFLGKNDVNNIDGTLNERMMFFCHLFGLLFPILGQQNRGVTAEKTALAVAARVEKSGQHDNIGDQVIDVVASQVTSGQRSTEVLKDGVLVLKIITSSIAGQICHEQRHQTILNSTELATAVVLKSAAGEILQQQKIVHAAEITSIVKEPQAAMLIKENPMIKQPMCIINTSDHDVHSQSLDSLGEKIGDSGQQLISTENDKDFVKGIPSISQAISTNGLIGSKKKQGETSAPWWADLIEEEGHFTSPPRSKLSPQAPVFVPSSKTNPSMTVTGTSSNSCTIKISLANRDMLHDLISHDMDTLNAIDNSKKSLTITTKDMGAFANSPEPEAVVSGLSSTTTYDIDLRDDMFDGNDEEDMLDLCFDKVAKDGISHCNIP
ncbi:hypothetical protein K7X08_011364 [Anisodus acutangulus]|uniref:Uncharacterized protein n=1 Tax=Anisodus acutangulus TaxID=402998 RepID=A0A9Q1MMW8_9SOLA|nr:hypothetical protein K7X08_011364 [Anisodus acutangulus]